MSFSVGFLFPGQGAQYVGMGRDVAEKFPSAARIFERADAILGFPLSRLCFDGPEENLTRTLYAQPALFVTSLAVLAALRDKFPELHPSLTAGLSLGEFTALTAAGALSFEDGLRLVRVRAEAMEECAKEPPGTMASILGLDRTQCEEIAYQAGCEIANINAPDQIVVSGKQAAVEQACRIAESAGAKRAILLKVGGAFHSSLMKPAREKLADTLRGTPLSAPQSVFLANVTGADSSDPEEIRRLLADQLISPVQWVLTMQSMADSKLPLFLEIGPGKVLKGLAKKAFPQIAIEPCGSCDEIEKIEPKIKLCETQ